LQNDLQEFSFILTSDTNNPWYLVVKGIIVILVVIILLDMAGRIGSYWSKPYPVYLLSEAKRLQASAYAPEVILTGNSHSRSILIDRLNRKAFHFWLSGQTLAESEQIIRILGKDMHGVKLILRTVSPGWLARQGNLAQGIASPRIARVLVEIDTWKALRYFWPGNVDSWIRALSLHVLRHDNWGNVARNILRLTGDFDKKRERIDHDPFNPELASNRVKGVALLKSRDSGFRKLGALLRASDSLGACLVLVESPLSEVYINEFQKLRPAFSDWKNSVRKYVSENKQEFCIYFIEGLWTGPERLLSINYKNSDHLNRRGSKLFTRALRDKLESLFYIKSRDNVR